MPDYKELPNFNPRWITEDADREMVDYADKVGERLKDEGLSNSQIRNIYGEMKRIQMGKFENNKSSFYLLKAKVAYASGRERNPFTFTTFKKVFDQAHQNVNDEHSFHNFCNLMEAILAYHKSHGGE